MAATSQGADLDGRDAAVAAGEGAGLTTHTTGLVGAHIVRETG